MSDGGARALSLTDVLGAIGALRTELIGGLRTEMATLQTNWGVLLKFASSDIISSQFGANLDNTTHATSSACRKRPSWRRTAN